VKDSLDISGLSTQDLVVIGKKEERRKKKISNIK
jgi:hypothetical protein